MKYLPKSRSENIVVQNLHGEVLVYDLTINKAFCLNETSAIVWQLCDGEKQISEISREVSEKLKSPTNEDLVWLALGQLKKENLLVNAESLPDKFEGVNRREVIKKIGVASMVALPVISFLVAPTASHAASGTRICGDPTLTSCSTIADCINSPTGDSCENNCCVFGGGIPGDFCIPKPGFPPCPVLPPGCDFFGC